MSATAINVDPRASFIESAPSANNGPKIREASFEDYSRIAALQVAYKRPIKPYEEWRHLWTNNPAYLRLRNALPIGWVVERADKEMVGYLGNIPFLYEIGGRRLLVCAAHAWVVDARYRPYALALLNLYFSQKNVDLFLNSTVGPASVESFGVFQSSRVPVGDWDRSVFWITNGPGFLAAWLREKEIPYPKPLSYGLAVGLALRRALSIRPLSRIGCGQKLQLCRNFDGRFDTFWESLRKNNPNLLLAVRSREMLEWHFRYPLRNNEAWILTAGTDPIVAYAIFLRQDNPKVGLTRMRLVDYQALDGSTTVLVPMLAWALEKCSREGVHMLECLGLRTEYRRAIAELAPYERKLPCWMFFYKAPDSRLEERLKAPDAWDPAPFDGDASL